MAHVDRGQASGGRSRAQIIVVAGFLLALGIIVVTTSLNLVIFAQDLSSRDVTPYEREVDDVRNVVSEGSTSAVTETNERNLRDDELNPPDNGDTEELYNSYADDFSDSVENLTLRDGEYLNVTMSVDDTAWRVTQTEEGELTNNDGDADWQMTDLSKDVEQVYEMSFNFSDTDSDSFTVLSINDDGAIPVFKGGWSMRVTESEIVTCSGTVFDNSGNFCGGPGGNREDIDSDWDGNGTIQIVNGSVNGEQRSELQNDWVDDGDEYYLRFEGSDNAEGTHDIRFNSGATPTDEACGSVPCSGSDDEEPTLTGAVNSTTTDYQYLNGEVNHTGDVEVSVP